jgi:predicted GTPase
LINRLTDSDTAKVGEELDSCTKSISNHDFEVDERMGTIIDTPGFDDTFNSDTEILIMTSDYLKATYVMSYRPRLELT